MKFYNTNPKVAIDLRHSIFTPQQGILAYQIGFVWSLNGVFPYYLNEISVN